MFVYPTDGQPSLSLVHLAKQDKAVDPLLLSKDIFSNHTAWEFARETI